MLIPPTRGFAISVNRHNVELDALVDWVEACITFVDDDISQSDVADVLIEEGKYREQDFAKERIADACLELQRRSDCLGDAGTYKVLGPRIQRARDWNEAPAFSFCLMASLQGPYREYFHPTFGDDYSEQGLLLERLTAEAMEAIGWRTYPTGWSKMAADSLEVKIEALAGHLNEETRDGALEKWTEEKAKDAGLDVVCHLPFPDNWSGRPLLYVQCASGDNWKDKRATPNLKMWEKLLDLATEPRKGLAVPFAFLAEDFRRAANYDALSLLLDRQRLSAPPSQIASWLSSDLVEALNNWTGTRLTVLLKARSR